MHGTWSINPFFTTSVVSEKCHGWYLDKQLNAYAAY